MEKIWIKKDKHRFQMKTGTSAAVFFLIAFLFNACVDSLPSWVCPGSGSKIRMRVKYDSHNRVDILFVVNNSQSLIQNIPALEERFRSLITVLMDPSQSMRMQYGARPVDDVRFAVVNTHMKLSSGRPGCEDAGALEGNGTFQTQAEGDACRETYDDWTQSPGSNDGDAMADDLVCLVNGLDKSGCIYKMPLYTAYYAVGRMEQRSFLRGDTALLAFVIISDEDDCSATTDSGFFNHDDADAADPDLGTYCARHGEDLIDPLEFADLLKRRGDFEAAVVPGSVVFVAISGVPVSESCQGAGDRISACLDEEEMQFSFVQRGERMALAPACEWESAMDAGASDKDAGASEKDTGAFSAAPAPRLVKAAIGFEEYGYVHSICNRGWESPMLEISKRIRPVLKIKAASGGVLKNYFDEDTKTLRCDLIFEDTGAACPAGMSDYGSAHRMDGGVLSRCRIEPLPHARSCTGKEHEDVMNTEKSAWIYCEGDGDLTVQGGDYEYESENVFLTQKAQKQTADNGTLWIECAVSYRIPEGECSY